MAVKSYWQTVAIQYTLIPKYSNPRLLSRKAGYALHWSQTHLGRETLPHKLMSPHSRSRTGMRRSTSKSVLTGSLGQYWLQDSLLVSSSGFNMEIQGVPRVLFSTATPVASYWPFSVPQTQWASNTVGIKYKVSCMLGTALLLSCIPSTFSISMAIPPPSTRGERESLEFAGKLRQGKWKVCFSAPAYFVFKIQNQNSLD